MFVIRRMAGLVLGLVIVFAAGLLRFAFVLGHRGLFNLVRVSLRLRLVEVAGALPPVDDVAARGVPDAEVCAHRPGARIAFLDSGDQGLPLPLRRLRVLASWCPRLLENAAVLARVRSQFAAVFSDLEARRYWLAVKSRVVLGAGREPSGVQ